MFTIHVEQKSNGGSTETGIRSKITLIDMAGVQLLNTILMLNTFQLLTG